VRLWLQYPQTSAVLYFLALQKSFYWAILLLSQLGNRYLKSILTEFFSVAYFNFLQKSLEMSFRGN